MPDLHLDSKTVVGLLFLILIAVSLSLAGKLTPEMVEVIKWVGTAYMSVRAIANYTENKAK